MTGSPAQRTLAIFDYDGTLIRWDSTLICAWPAVRHRLLSLPEAARMAAYFIGAEAGLVSREAALAAGFAIYSGRSLDEIREGFAKMYRLALQAHVSRAIRERVVWHQQQKHHLVIATAGAALGAEPLAGELNVDAVIGTGLDFENGLCTGRTSGPIVEGEEKVNAVRRYAANMGLDFTTSWFYSDGMRDLPLLNAVKTPVVVGRDAKLRRVALRRGWECILHD